MHKQNNILHNTLFENIVVFEGQDKYSVPEETNRICVLYRQEDAQFIGFLNDILKATKIDSRDFSIFEIPEGLNPNTNVLFDNAQCETLIFFGFSNQELGIPDFCKNYQSVRIRDKNLLLAESLGKIHSDKNLKGILWKSLKEMFNIA